MPMFLEQLYLTDNALTDIRALEDLRYLRELRISGNSVASVDSLAQADRLMYLHLDDNEVSDLSPLNFKSLREVHFRNNAVKDVSPLLSGDKLLMVDMRRNPLGREGLDVASTLRDRGVTVLAGETVPYFPTMGGSREGFVRVINRSPRAGDVFIEAVDDAGVRVAPVRLAVGARRAVHFSSGDLEGGNAAKGLSHGIGRPRVGDWRLELVSPLDVEVLSYIRTEDGFVTAMHDVASGDVLPFFNPGSNQRQRSILRTVNTEAERAKWVTGGYDDSGKWYPMWGSITVRPGRALTRTAAALETRHRLGYGEWTRLGGYGEWTRLGDSQGKWRLRVRGFPWFAMSLLESPTGHLTNLSTTPANSVRLEQGGHRHRVPLFPAAGGDAAGFVRVINQSQSPGKVAIVAVDDHGDRVGPVELTLRPGRTAHFNSEDLETGSAAKGLSSGVGGGHGDWRLELSSTLDLMVLSYIRTGDGFVTSMHDLAPRSDDGHLWIPFFNPGANRNQVSHLRLANWGEAAARVTITGTDDRGRSPGGAVRVTIPAGAARQFTAAQLETGNADGLSGALGDGAGKWRLRVATSEEVDAMSLLSLPTGHITNLSTTPRYPRREHR